VIPLHLLVASLVGWLERDLHEIILYPREENRALKAQLRSQRVRLTGRLPGPRFSPLCIYYFPVTRV
jgi:hypothetical protein